MTPAPTAPPRPHPSSRRAGAVLLDVDGTLLASNDAHAQAWVEVLRRHGREVAYDAVRPLIGKGGDKLLQELAGLDADDPEAKRISAERKQLFIDEWLPKLQPTPGARALLQRLQADGMRLLVATSAVGSELKGLLRQAGIDDLIETAATSSDAEDSKPDPDIVEAALNKGRIAAAEAVMIGDTPYDIEAAAKSAVATIALRCGGWWDDAAFAGAVAIYDDPADLLRRIDTSPLAR